MTSIVYFEETLDNLVYVGYTDKLAKRRRQHANEGCTFLAALPGDGGGTGTAEKEIHAHFADSLVRGGSCFGGEEIKDYVAWLVSRGFASDNPDDALKCSRLPFSMWHPANAGDPFTEPNGQMLLHDSGSTARGRVERASKYAHLMSMTDQWFTPPAVIDLARKALGGHIDTDPASCSKANEWIDARLWYSVDVDGLTPAALWRGTVWLNPPYGTGRWSAEAFVWRLVDELRQGNVTSAITCLNLNSASALWFDRVWQAASKHLIWRGRIDFIHPGGKQDSSPSKGTILSYFGDDQDLFAEVFSDYGTLLDATSAREAARLALSSSPRP